MRWWLGVLLLVLLVPACSAVPQEMGTLEGHVSLTMTPVLREGLPEPTPAPEAYAVRQIVIFRQDGRKEMDIVSELCAWPAVMAWYEKRRSLEYTWIDMIRDNSKENADHEYSGSQAETQESNGDIAFG